MFSQKGVETIPLLAAKPTYAPTPVLPQPPRPQNVAPAYTPPPPLVSSTPRAPLVVVPANEGEVTYFYDVSSN